MRNKELVKQNLLQSWRGYEAFLLLIAVLEGMMMIYGWLVFDFRELRRRLYFVCYVLLFFCTVVAFVINRLCMKSGKHDTLLVHNVYLYNGLLIFWSATISALDLMGNGYPVTYMTILAAVGSMIAIPPVMYGCMAALSSAYMIALVLCTGQTRLHLPFYLNFTIFLLVVISVEVRNYRAMRNQLLLDRHLQELAEVDGLTRIFNRRRLDGYMEQLIAEDTGFTFSLLDVDNFKFINDTSGHQEGDQCLIHIAGLLSEFFGQQVFRYGGDEFAVISFEDARSVAEKFTLLNSLLKQDDKAYSLQICAGVYPRQAGDDERHVFERADSALYQAKQSGKARTVIYSP